jgi:hypothetical protein
MYKIERVYLNKSGKRCIARNLTLKQAQDHCSNPETSSSRCKSATSKAITRRNGPWMDTYSEQ